MVVYIIDLFALLHMKFHVVCSLLISLFNYCTVSNVGNISTDSGPGIWVLLASMGLLLSDFIICDPEDEDEDLGDHTKSYYGGSLTLMQGSFVGVHLVVVYCNLGDWLLLSLLFTAAATFISKIYFKKKKEKKKTKQEFVFDQSMIEVIRLVGGVEDDIQELKEEMEHLIRGQKEQRKPIAEINSTSAVSKLKIRDMSVEVQNTQTEVRHIKSEVQDVKAKIIQIQKTLNQPLVNGKSRKMEGCSRLECCHCSLLPPSFVFQCNIGHLLCQPCLPLISGACPLCLASLPDPPCRNLLAEACIQAMDEVD